MLLGRGMLKMKKLQARFMDYWRDGELRWPDWIIAAFCYCIVALATIYYGDVVHPWRAGVVFDEALFGGNIQNYYSLFVDYHASGYTWSMPVNSFVYILLYGILSLPIYAIRAIASYDITDGIFGLIYIKAVLSAFVFACGVAVLKITGASGRYGRGALYLFITSPLVILTAVVGNDIVTLLAVLLMLHYAVLQRQRPFLLFAALAILLKDYSLLIFIPVLLLTDKKATRLIGKMAIAVIPYAIFKFILAGDPARNSIAGIWDKSNFGTLLGVTLPVFGVNAPLFAAAFLLICVFAYQSSATPDGDFKKRLLFMPMLVTLSMAVFSTFRFNWSVLLIPFIVLNAEQYKQDKLKFRTIVITETLVCTGFIVCWLFADQPFLQNHIFDHMLLRNFVASGEYRYRNISEFLSISQSSAETIRNICGALVFSCCVALVAMCSPKGAAPEATGARARSAEPPNLNNRGLLLARSVLVIAFLAPLFVSAAIPRALERLVWSAPIEWQLLGQLDNSYALEQTFSFDEKINARSLALWFQSDEHDPYSDPSSAEVLILDAGGNTLLKKTMALNENIRGDWSVEERLDVDGIVFKSGEQYKIIINGRWIKEPWFPVVTDAQPNTQLVVNGNSVDGKMLAMMLVAKS
jgi:hypothetical protein